jgi:hypothetical protein
MQVAAFAFFYALMWRESQKALRAMTSCTGQDRQIGFAPGTFGKPSAYRLTENAERNTGAGNAD